jgi:uncharacterized membrane protein
MDKPTPDSPAQEEGQPLSESQSGSQSEPPSGPQSEPPSGPQSGLQSEPLSEPAAAPSPESPVATEPPPSYVKLAMRNMVRKRGKSLQHFFLTTAGLLAVFVGLAYLTRG